MLTVQSGKSIAASYHHGFRCFMMSSKDGNPITLLHFRCPHLRLGTTDPHNTTRGAAIREEEQVHNHTIIKLAAHCSSLTAPSPSPSPYLI